MKHILSMAIFLLASILSIAAENKLAYVIPIHGEIEQALVYVIRRGVAEATKSKADVLIIDMDTPGGRVSSAEEILHILENTEILTCTFVNPNAISAGALIALGTDKIYMTENGRIGDAMPIMMSPIPMTGPVDMPEKEREKITSYVDSLARSAAQRNGHNQDVATAMVRPNRGLKIGDTVICQTNQLLTLTSKEAEQPGPDGKPLLSSGTVKNMDELLDRLNLKSAEQRILRITPSEKIARFIESFPVSSILLALAILAIWIEIKTPGFGVPGITGAVLLLIWFWGHNVAGLAGWEEILLFSVGLVLLLVEIFVLPGFGFAGTTGIALILAALVMAMMEHTPGGAWLPSADDLGRAMSHLGLAFLLCAAGVLLLARYLPSMKMFRRVTLEAAIPANQGYVASESNTSSIVGLKGVAETDLRPSGIGIFNDRRLSVVARGSFINRGSPIVVEEAEGNRIVVSSQV